MQLSVDPHHALPPSKQLVECVLNGLVSQDAGVGDQLPSVREAAVAARVNPNTVSKAWRELQRMGVVVSRSGSGVFVTEDGPRIARERQGAATLKALSEAVEAALAAGHQASRIEEHVAECLAARTSGGER